MSTDPSETRNFCRFIVAFIKIGRKTLLKLLYSKKPKNELKQFIESKDTDLKKYLSNRKRKTLKDLLANNPDALDISFILALLTSLFEFRGIMKNDLNRLRRIRNAIAHSPNATLNDEKYNEMFETLHTIICRITEEVDKDNVDSVAREIEKCKQGEPDFSLANEYKAMLQGWRDGGVELTLKYKNDLKLFFGDGNKKYIRYCKLLVDAAPMVLKEFLLERLKSQRQTVPEFLVQYKVLLMDKLNIQGAVLQLFRMQEDGTADANPDIDSWDMCVVAEILLIVFGSSLRKNVRRNIDQLKKAKESFAAVAIEASNREKLDHCCEDLVHNLRSLAVVVNDDVVDEVEHLIDIYRSDIYSDIDLTDLLEKLKGLEIISIAKKHKASVDDLIEKLEEDDSQENLQYIVELKVHIICDKYYKSMAEQTIIDHFDSSRSDEENKIQALNEIKKTINGFPGTSVIGARKESVVLTIRCQSNQSLLQIINYIHGKEFQEHLKNFEAELEDIFDDFFCVMGYLTLETLERLIDPLSGQLKKPSEDGVVLSLASTSQEGSNLKRHRDEDLNIELQTERKLVQRPRQEIDKHQTENPDLRRTKAQERRRRSEQDPIDTIAGLESNEQTLERRYMTLETQLQEARPRAESDAKRIHTLREEIATSRRELEQEKDKRRSDCQRLQNELIEREKSLREEQERRRRSEQDFRNTIAGLESNVQTLERKIMTLETHIQEAGSNQRQRAESDAERIQTLREEIATSRREIEQEKMNRRIDCQRFQNELTVREKSLREAEQENMRLRERQERTEQELERRQETIIELKEDSNNARTERTRLEIQMADTERQYSQKITEMKKESLCQDQELRDLREKFDAVTVVIQNYIRKNVRINTELRRLRERLDHVDREQKDNSDTLQRAKLKRYVNY